MTNELADKIHEGDRGNPGLHAQQLLRLAGLGLQAAAGPVSVERIDDALAQHDLSSVDRLTFKLALTQAGVLRVR